MSTRRVKGARWEALRRQVLVEESECFVCGGALGALPYPDPLSPTVEHIVPLGAGGHPTDRANLAASHLRCNTTRENRRRRRARLNTSRDW